MPWMMPQMPPELLKVLGNGATPTGNVPPVAAPGVAPAPAYGPPKPPAPAPPIQMGPGGVNLAPKDPNPPPFVNQGNGSMALPQDVMRSSLGPTQQKPASSDDPGITGQLPTPPDITQSPVAGAYKRYSDLAAQRESIQPPNRADFKPTWKDRLLGGTVALLSGNAKAGADLTTRKFRNASSDFNDKTGNLDKQLEIERGGLAAAKDVGELPQRDFENKIHVTREGRERATGEARIGEEKARAARLQDQIDNPPHREPKNADEALSAASAETDPQEKARLIKLASDLHTQEIDRVKSARPPREEKTASKTASVGIENKKAQALSAAKRQYDKETENAGNDPDLRKQADDNFKQAQQDAQDAYEAEIAANGGTPSHQDTSTWRGATPPPAAKPGQTAAQPAAAKPASGKATPKVGDVRTVKGGKKVRITKVFGDGTFNADPAN